LIGCDGIYETLSNQEIVTFFLNEFDKSEPLSCLLDKFFERNIAKTTSNIYGCDNMTSILIWLKEF